MHSMNLMMHEKQNIPNVETEINWASTSDFFFKKKRGEGGKTVDTHSFFFFFFVSIMSDWNSNDLQENFGMEKLDCLLRSSFN